MHFEGSHSNMPSNQLSIELMDSLRPFFRKTLAYRKLFHQSHLRKYCLPRSLYKRYARLQIRESKKQEVQLI